MNYENLKATIAANIYTNGNQEVTAAMVKTAMNEVVNTLGTGYQYMGVAHPDDAAASYDQHVFFIATEPGTYTNKGGLQVAEGEVAILKYDTAWHKEGTGAATAAEVTALGQKVGALDVAQCSEDGLLFVDDSMNIGIKIDNEGLFAINGVNY